MNDANGAVDLSQGKVQKMDRTPYDTGNQLLAQMGAGAPVEITFAKVQTQQGQRLAVTFRTPNTTFTAFFGRADGLATGTKIVEECSTLTSLLVTSQVPPTFKP